MDIQKTIQIAIEHHQAGRLPEAESAYRKIIQIEPSNSATLHLYGLLADQQGRGELAVELLGKAVRFNPSNPTIYISLGNALQVIGKLDEAVENYRQALLRKPDLAEVHYNLGVAFQAQGKFGEAVEHYQQAVALNPNDVDTHNNLAMVLQGMGKPDAAIMHYRLALGLHPGHAIVHINLGVALFNQGELDAAAERFHHALALQPDSANAHYNLGHVFKERRQLDAATASYRKALMLKPGFAEAHNNLGNVLREQGKLDEAVRSYHDAISFRPDDAEALSNLLFLYSYHDLIDAREYIARARNWEQVCVPAHERQLARDKTFQRPPHSGRRLRVGYVSGDYYLHAVSYFIEQLFAHHDRERIELFAYSNNRIWDAVSERLQSLADHWVSIAGMSDSAVLERMHADEIDVLIDLSGHTEHKRLGVFARRAAPVQAHYLGYFASTGLTEMDYWIGDEILTPAETDNHFSEQVWRLPRVWVSYKTIENAPEPDWHPAGDGSVCLGSFNNLGKLTPATLKLWAGVLHALPEARLLLKNKELADAGNRQRILDAMAGHGIAPGRIELQRESDWAGYMAQYNRLDIALDPVGGHGGGTITCDALWMGVPVIHALGERATSRFTASMLNAIGHPEWIALDEAEYIDKVVTLARDVGQRKALRLVQRERMASSPLCDAKDLAGSLENAYVAMFERWREKQNGRILQVREIS